MIAIVTYHKLWPYQSSIMSSEIAALGGVLHTIDESEVQNHYVLNVGPIVLSVNLRA